VTNNQDVFSQYWDELRGMSDGSGQPLHLHVLSTLSQEISYYLPKGSLREESNVEHCSDYMILSENHAIVGHNEVHKTQFCWMKRHMNEYTVVQLARVYG
jgi:hypothetical protein